MSKVIIYECMECRAVFPKYLSHKLNGDIICPKCTSSNIIDATHVYNSPINDSGKRKEYDTGSMREPADGKGRFDLIPPEMMFRLSKWYELGAKKYEDRNWEKGLPVSVCMNSLLRHAFKYLDGWDDEDHLAAIIWNAAAIMYYEKHLPAMQDLPSHKANTDTSNND